MKTLEILANELRIFGYDVEILEQEKTIVLTEKMFTSIVLAQLINKKVWFAMTFSNEITKIEIL